MSEQTQKPINPKKAWGIVLVITLITFTFFGSFILKNLLTLALIAILIATWYFGSQNQIKNLGWVVAGVIAIEFVTWATGMLDPLFTRLANFGGELQCLSGLTLVCWVIYIKRHSIARSFGIPEGTGQAMADAAKQAVQGANDWARK